MLIRKAEIKLAVFWLNFILLYMNMLLNVESTSGQYQLHQNSKIQIETEQNAQIWLLQNDGGYVEDTNNKNLILGSNVRKWEIVLNLKVHEGEADFYFYAGQEVRKKQGHLSKGDEDVFKEQEMKMKGYFKLREGVNVITEQNIRKILNQQNRIWNRNFVYQVIVFPKTFTRFVLKMGQISKQIEQVRMQTSKDIKMEGNRNGFRIFRLNIVNNNYEISIRRIIGYPNIKIYECKQGQILCFYQPYYVGQKEQHARWHIKHRIESMLIRQQRISGRKCEGCEMYLRIEQRMNERISIVLFLNKKEFIDKLIENEINKQSIISGNEKQYSVSFTEDVMRVSLQVYEGEIEIKAQQLEGPWRFNSGRCSGMLKFQMPNKSPKQTRQVHMIVTAYKDTTYSIVYSSGEYEVFIKDGYPTSHILKENENITFVYENMVLNDSFIYVTLNVNETIKGQNMNIKVFVYKQEEGKIVRKEFIGNERIQKQRRRQEISYGTHVVQKNVQYQHDKLIQQTKAIVIQLPGDVPKFQIFIQLKMKSTIQMTMTINDEQILFVPLGHNVPLQIDKDNHVNLYVDNNQEGFVQLIVKKCDESDPKIAYSLNPTDFMKQDFDYQSFGEKGRIVRNVVKVGKGKGVYLRISGDRISDSFVLVTAKYLHIDHIKLQKQRQIKRGDNGGMSYQLITNSKVEIWFQQLECSKQCRQNVKYQFYLSNQRSDLFRQMICPGIVVFKNQEKNVVTQSFFLNQKPSYDGIIAFKQVLDFPIVYISVKAIYGSQNDAIEFIYENIEIVTFLGQVGRMSTQFLIAIVLGAFGVCLGIIWIVKKQGKLGYKKIRARENSIGKKRESIEEKQEKGGERTSDKQEQISDDKFDIFQKSI